MSKKSEEKFSENFKKVGKIFKECLKNGDLIPEDQAEFPEDGRDDTQKTPRGERQADDYHYGHA